MIFKIILVLLTISYSVQENLFDLHVIHMNDFHSRFEEINEEGLTCSANDCMGGFSRLYKQVKEITRLNPNAILLNAGDNFFGTLWYRTFKWNITQHFLNKLPFDAIALGNHDFDDGISGVVSYVKHLNSPIIAANIDDSNETDFQGIYSKSVIINRNGLKIGIIGITTPSTVLTENPGRLVFLDPSESVNREAERLVKEEDVFTIIVLSHCGYDQDQLIARNVSSKVTLIVGGHTHSYLYDGDDKPGPDIRKGPYPTVVKKRDGKQVLVVQAGSFAKYLGNIRIYYNSQAEPVYWNGNPIFLSRDFPQDEDINKELAEWRRELVEINNEKIGSSIVDLETDCLYGECLMGNFITDAFVHKHTRKPEPGSWTNAAIAVINSIRINKILQKGDITYNLLSRGKLFGLQETIGEISGKTLLEMFEQAAKPIIYHGVYHPLNLLQVSGIRLVYNLNRPEGSRVVDLKVRCRECKIPKYEPLIMEKFYNVSMISHVILGNDGFGLIPKGLIAFHMTRYEMDVIEMYVKEKSPIYEEIGGRIQFVANID